MNKSNGIFKVLQRKMQRSVLCQAPFSNMLIDQQGNVRICCHQSNDFSIGKYPESTLHDIWFGPVRKKMCDEMISGKIPEECMACLKNGIHHQSPDSKIARGSAGKKSGFNSWPYQIEFLLDNRCNLSCIMCASNKSREIRDGYTRPPVEFGEDFLSQVRPFLKHAGFLVFSGGEPFLIPYYRRLWEYISEENPTAVIYVQTNGTVLNDDVRQLLIRHRMQLGISVDSLKDETYESIRRNASLKQLMDNLPVFIEHSRKLGNEMTLMMTPQQLNAAEVPDVLNYCNENALRFSLSILNWPYTAAIWALPAKTIKMLLDGYKSIPLPVNPSATVLRNHEIFHHFVRLTEQYYQEKEASELHSKERRDHIMRQAEEIRSKLPAEIAEIGKDPSYLNEDLSGFESDINALHEYLKPLVQNRNEPEIITYLIFNNRSMRALFRLSQEIGREQLFSRARERMEEIIFLLDHHLYHRI